MFDYYDTEAAHLSEIYDDAKSYFEPLTIEDKADYIRAKGRCFKKEDVGKYVVIQNSRRNNKVMPIMYLVDRRKTKRMWWSPASCFAMVFEKRSAAEYQARKYRFNNARVIQIKDYMADAKWFNEIY